VVVLGLITACDRTGSDRVADTSSARLAATQPQAPVLSASQPDPDTVGLRHAKLGVVFDPSRVRPGDTIAGLVVERIVANHTPMDSTLVGTAAFRGTIELAGATMRHPEADATKDVCFEADSASAARLPRWAGDRRRAWFCFSNASAAARELGPPQTERPAHVVISHFVIHRGLTDQVNAAQFLRLAGIDAIRARERADTLEGTAREIVGFLRGDIDFEKVKRLLADTVVLYLTPEGGRTARRRGASRAIEVGARVKSRDLLVRPATEAYEADGERRPSLQLSRILARIEVSRAGNGFARRREARARQAHQLSGGMERDFHLRLEHGTPSCRGCSLRSVGVVEQSRCR